MEDKKTAPKEELTKMLAERIEKAEVYFLLSHTRFSIGCHRTGKIKTRRT